MPGNGKSETREKLQAASYKLQSGSLGHWGGLQQEKTLGKAGECGKAEDLGGSEGGGGRPGEQRAAPSHSQMEISNKL